MASSSSSSNSSSSSSAASAGSGYNTRVEYVSSEVNYQQQAQEGRQEFTPGKADSRPQDQNWPKDFSIPTGNPITDAMDLERSVVIKTGRNSVSDVTIPPPQVEYVETRTETGAGYSGEYEFTETETQDNDGKQEKKSGFNGVLEQAVTPSSSSSSSP